MKNFVLLLIFSLFSINIYAQHYVGGDISLLSQYESHGAKYYTSDGVEIPQLLPFFKQEGMNAMRVRLFVDPSKATATEKGEGVCQDIEYVKALGRNIKEAGFAFMLDFHYSDTWADPGKQWTPEAWLGLNDSELQQKIHDYTKDCLEQLVAAGATPDFIQTGNEISYGMLWGDRSKKYSDGYYAGQSKNRDRFTTLLKEAGKACREVCPNAKIVLHIERSGQPSYAREFFTDMDKAGVDYDIIGLSYYSYYHGNLTVLGGTLGTLKNNFPTKPVMIVEAGYYHHWQPKEITGSYDLSATYPISIAGQKKFAEALIEKLQEHDNVTGLFWWWMEANEYGLDWNTKRVTDGWYNAGLFDNQTGRATDALSVLRTFLTPEQQAGIHTPQECGQRNTPPFNLAGQKISDNYKGIAIRNGKKIISF